MSAGREASRAAAARGAPPTSKPRRITDWDEVRWELQSTARSQGLALTPWWPGPTLGQKSLFFFTILGSFWGFFFGIFFLARGSTPGHAQFQPGEARMRGGGQPAAFSNFLASELDTLGGGVI